MSNRLGLFALAISVALLGGCLGTSDDALGARGLGSQQNGLLPTGPRASLPSVGQQRWLDAPAGCEEALPAEVRFGVTDGEPMLIVALTGGSEIACVDSFGAVHMELRTRGRVALADELAAQFEQTVQVQLTSAATDHHSSGDPSPQPSIDEHLAPVLGDPSPQPSRPLPELEGAAEGDPSPQPSSEPLEAKEEKKTSSDLDVSGGADSQRESMDVESATAT
jgi:hypothetical protein